MPRRRCVQLFAQRLAPFFTPHLRGEVRRGVMKPKFLTTRSLSRQWFIQIEGSNEEALVDGDFRMSMRYDDNGRLVELALPDRKFVFSDRHWRTTDGDRFDHIEWDIVEIAEGWHTLYVAGFSGGLWRLR